MQNAVRLYCCLRGPPNGGQGVFYACQALLLSLMLAGCGGEGASPRPNASAPALASSVQKNSSAAKTMTAESPALTSRAMAPPATADKPAAVSMEESARLARLRALSLLSSLSDRERAGLLKQLPLSSPSERLSLLNGYRTLAALPDRQKQVLLNQIEKIVPVTVSASQLVCSCSHGIQRKLCVRERCSNRSELQSACNEACGTLASFKNQCMTSRQCEVEK